MEYQRNWELIETINEPRTTSHLAISKDSKYLVSAGSDNNLNVYNLPNMQQNQVVQFLKKGKWTKVGDLKFDNQHNLHFSVNSSPNKNENGELIPVAIF